MFKGAAARWAILGSALMMTVVAIFYPVEESLTAPVRVANTLTTVPKTVIRAPSNATTAWMAPESDPFAPRGWVPPDAPPVALAVVGARDVQAVDATPPPPPALPYKFIGQMRDGREVVIYLGLGDQVVLARAGELLEGGYKVVAISANQIEFESVALGIHQTLPIPVQD